MNLLKFLSAMLALAVAFLIASPVSACPIATVAAPVLYAAPSCSIQTFAVAPSYGYGVGFSSYGVGFSSYGVGAGLGFSGYNAGFGYSNNFGFRGRGFGFNGVNAVGVTGLGVGVGGFSRVRVRVGGFGGGRAVVRVRGR